ncbi:hypothetical protein BUALT_Bualt11G0121900 [Buddleja alternifolia]|uniref:PGG domain-containing protein n=1 Tax=Buddleja alternifolia TaxID=168488 RepID=A0AAV6WVT9_9LAMI|nr:hypothetical protein BUALT_Bualt11G0121900 [Buddleja alternifolia]
MTKDSEGTEKIFGGFGIVPETLTEDNYEHWKRCLKTYLVGHGLWDVVSGKETEPHKHDQKQEHDEWKKKNALALHAIQLSCRPGTYSKFHKAHMSASHAWTYLADKASRPHPTPSRDHEDEEEADGQFKDNGMREHLDYEPLYRAIEENDWKATEEFLRDNPNAVKARVSSHKDTALHIAILSGHIEIAQKLLSKMEPCDLELINEYGATALSLAAVCGAKKLAKAIVNKNKHLVKLANGRDDGELPVIVAALYGQKHMVRYLYKVTPIYVLSPENGGKGVRLLNCLITADIYDIASLLLKRYPKLGVIGDDDGNYALKILAHKPSAFPSGTKFAFWEKLIYKCARIHSPWDRQQDGEEYLESQTSGDDADQRIEIHESSEEEIVEIEHGGLNITSRVPKIKYIHQKKLVHDEAVKLLSCMFEEIRKLSYSDLENMDIDTIIYDAIKHGIIEFIREMLKYKPDIIWKKDKIGRTIFAHAIVLRQEKIFSLIYGLGTRMRIMARRHDIFGNNYLHLAAKLSPPFQLERVSGAALQMQRELQWFKEVESIVQPKLKEEVNENSKKPETLFSDEHKKLATDAERWMKNTAGSSMIVGTLIAAVMFTTAFTVPGGNEDKTGLPIMFKSHPHPFLIFMVSNALSMFSSTTSLLMFLGILTARYAEEDFLTSLPSKLIFGLASLFFSIVTMMSSFGAALYLTLHDQLHWITIPIIILSVIPIALFSICQFPLLIEMTNRTYGSGIFDKPKKTYLQQF